MEREQKGEDGMMQGLLIFPASKCAVGYGYLGWIQRGQSRDSIAWYCVVALLHKDGGWK